MSLRHKHCATCKAEFVGHHRRMYCSPGCQGQLKRDYWKAYRVAHAKPKEVDIFDPFPPEIDRDAFGSWLSGFSAGEATFILRKIVAKRDQKIIYSAQFRIALRDDEVPVLKLIRSYWACGGIYFSDNVRSKIANAKPVASFSIQKSNDLASVIIPHFERFPLHAKKSNDFAIWKRGVSLMTEVQARPLVGRINIGGSYARWSDSDRTKFESLVTELTSCRKYIDNC